MKRFYQLGISSIVLLAGLAVAAERSEAVYHVSEVVRTLTPISFECRLSDVPGAPQTRFQVILKGMLAVPGKEIQTLAELDRILRNASKIELRQPRTRNYFRVEAQVWADSEELSQKLLSQELLRAEELDAGAIPVAEPLRPARPVPMPAGAPAPSKRVYPPRYGLQQLLETRIDLSLLRSETSLEDALRMISTSLEPRLPMVVYWSDVQNNAFLDKDSPIGVEGFGVISAAQALDAILYSVSGYGVPLKFTISGGILKIGTTRTLSYRTTEVYSVVDLVSPPAYDTSETGYETGGGGSGYSASPRSR